MTDSYTHPDWEERPFWRDMATTERWDRLDDLDAVARERQDRLTRDSGERPGRAVWRDHVNAGREEAA